MAARRPMPSPELRSRRSAAQVSAAIVLTSTSTAAAIGEQVATVEASIPPNIAGKLEEIAQLQERVRALES